MARILFVDDIRDPSYVMLEHNRVDVVRTYADAIARLETEEYDRVCLDHDLADFRDGREYTGYDIVLWLVQRKMDGHYVPPEYDMLTSNPVGRRNMMETISRYLTEE